MFKNKQDLGREDGEGILHSSMMHHQGLVVSWKIPFESISFNVSAAAS